MSNQYRLVGLGNSELVAGLSALVQHGNVLTAQLLAHLVELEERKLHCELGFPSLFAYCVEALGMSEGTAGRRVTAARVCRRHPELFERLAGVNCTCVHCVRSRHIWISGTRLNSSMLARARLGGKSSNFSPRGFRVRMCESRSVVYRP